MVFLEEGKGYLTEESHVETFDYDVVDKIYDPYDNLGLSVILHGDGTREYKVLGSLAEAVKGTVSRSKAVEPVKKIFASKSLQLVSFTITEKGYALQKADGTWFPFVESDIKNGPEQVTGAMAVLVAMLLERYKAGKISHWHWYRWITVRRMVQSFGSLY